MSNFLKKEIANNSPFEEFPDTKIEETTEEVEAASIVVIVLKSGYEFTLDCELTKGEFVYYWKMCKKEFLLQDVSGKIYFLNKKEVAAMSVEDKK